VSTSTGRAFFDDLQNGAAREQPGRVCVAQVVQTHRRLQPGGPEVESTDVVCEAAVTT
jgi:hypothetical protein